MPCSRSVSWRAPAPTHSPSDTVSRLRMLSVTTRRPLASVVSSTVIRGPRRTARVSDSTCALGRADVVVDGGEALLGGEQARQPLRQRRALARDRLAWRRGTWPGARSTARPAASAAVAQLALGGDDGAGRVRIDEIAALRLACARSRRRRRPRWRPLAAKSRRMRFAERARDRSCPFRAARASWRGSAARRGPRLRTDSARSWRRSGCPSTARSWRPPRASRRRRRAACAAGCR